MKPPEDKRPQMVVASQLLHEATSAAISMAIFPLGGYWLDDRWGTTPWLTVLGAVVGFSLGMKQLVNLGKPRRQESSGKSGNGKPVNKKMSGRSDDSFSEK
jgi:F0F1-type ATP synthase assembly protein I